jgi:hypothetical protein
MEKVVGQQLNHGTMITERQIAQKNLVSFNLSERLPAADDYGS